MFNSRNEKSKFRDGDDFIEEKDYEKRGNFWTVIGHSFSRLIKPYTARGDKTHRRELEERKVKCQWDMLRAMNRKDRQIAKECVKCVLLIQAFFNKISEVKKSEIVKAEEGVKATRTYLKQEQKAYNEAHKNPRRKPKTGHNSKQQNGHRRRKRKSSDEKQSDDDDIDSEEIVNNNEEDYDEDDDADNDNGHRNDNGHPSEDDHVSNHGKNNNNHDDDEDNYDDDDDDYSDGDHSVSASKHGNVGHHNHQRGDDAARPPAVVLTKSKSLGSRVWSKLTRSLSRKHSNRNNDNDNDEWSPPVHQCEATQKMEQKRDDLASAKSTLAQAKDLGKRAKSVRNFFHKFRSLSMKSSNSNNLVTDFQGFYIEITKSDEAKNNKFFKENLYNVMKEYSKNQTDGAASEIIVMDQYFERKALELFAKGPGFDFLRNLTDLSQSMTAHELMECKLKLSWFPYLDIAVNQETINANGSGVAPAA